MEQQEHPLFKKNQNKKKQLLNFNGNLLTYTDFLSKFNFPVTPKEYAVVFNALLSGMLQLLQGMIAYTPISDLLNRGKLISKVDVTKKKCSSKLIRTFLRVILIWSS